MKKPIALVLFILFVSMSCFAQTKSRKYEYAIVQLDDYKNKVNIIYGTSKEVDFNELKNIKSFDNLRRNTGIVVDALNYMDEQGYDLVSSVSAGNLYHYTFRREIKNK